MQLGGMRQRARALVAGLGGPLHAVRDAVRDGHLAATLRAAGRCTREATMKARSHPWQRRFRAFQSTKAITPGCERWSRG
jgi:hypothetical protein